jgi:hypothetical protein
VEKKPKGINRAIFSSPAMDNPSSNKSKLKFTLPLIIEVVPKSPPIIPVIFRIINIIRIQMNSHNIRNGINFVFKNNFTPVNTQKTIKAKGIILRNADIPVSK